MSSTNSKIINYIDGKIEICKPVTIIKTEHIYVSETKEYFIKQSIKQIDEITGIESNLEIPTMNPRFLRELAHRLEETTWFDSLNVE